MKKTMFTLLVALATGGWLSAQTTTASSPLVIKKVTGTINIDGAGDDEGWTGISEQDIAVKKTSETPNSSFTAKFKMTYDENTIYLLVTVNDPTPEKINPTASWQSDCVELFFAMDTADTSKYRAHGDWQLRIRSSSDYAVVDSLDGNHGPGDTYNVSSMRDPSKLEVGYQLTGNTYVMEWKISLWALVDTANFDGKMFRFDIQVANNDDGNTRVNQLFWNSAADDQYQVVKNQGYVKFETPIPTAIAKPAIAKASSIRIKANSIEFAKAAKEVNVYSITGQLMLKARNVNAISTSTLKSGVYFVVADGEKAKFVIK